MIEFFLANYLIITYNRLIPSNYSWYAAYLADAYPLDMIQYQHLFKSTRIPNLNMDYNKAFPDAKHILVMKNGRFYTFDVIDPIDGMTQF